jgi:hypothetical protein
MDVSFRDFIEKFRNIGGAKAIVSNINFQEELFNLEHSATNLIRSRTKLFEPPKMVKCQYANSYIKFFDYENREPRRACVNYGLLVPISLKLGTIWVLTPALCQRSLVSLYRNMTINTKCGHMP